MWIINYESLRSGIISVRYNSWRLSNDAYNIFMYAEFLWKIRCRIVSGMDWIGASTFRIRPWGGLRRTVRFWKKWWRGFVRRPHPSAFKKFQPFAIWVHYLEIDSGYKHLSFCFAWNVFYDFIVFYTWFMAANLIKIIRCQWIFR